MTIAEQYDLKNKIAIVTGCSRGIGMAIATGLAEAGADIIGVSSSLAVESEVEKKVMATGCKFYPYQCDFSNRQSLYDFINNINNRFATIDILVNNAGIIKRNPAAEHSDEYWDEVIAVNQTAPFILSREVGKKMLLQEKGKIIFIASLLTFQGGINVPGYAASKGAIAQLTKALANEWAAKGINVNAIAPGYIDTDNTTDLRNDPVRSKSILDRIPAGHWGNAADIKGAAVFLCGAASDYINGSVITVDGGWMAR